MTTTTQATAPVEDARAKAIKAAADMAAKTRPVYVARAKELIGKTPLPTAPYGGFQDRDRWYEAGTYTSHKDERAQLIAHILRSEGATHAEVGTVLNLHTPKYSGGMCAKGAEIAAKINTKVTAAA